MVHDAQWSKFVLLIVHITELPIVLPTIHHKVNLDIDMSKGLTLHFIKALVCVRAHIYIFFEERKRIFHSRRIKNTFHMVHDAQWSKFVLLIVHITKLRIVLPTIHYKVNPYINISKGLTLHLIKTPIK
jgi:hypothetical protein